MPGSLLALGDSLAYPSPPSTSYSNLSIAPNSALTSPSSLSSPSTVAAPTMPKVAPVAPQTVSANNSSVTPANPNSFLPEPALTGETIFSSSPTDPINSGSSGASSVKPTTGTSGQNGPAEQAAPLNAAVVGPQTSPALANDSPSNFAAQPTPTPAPIVSAPTTPAVVGNTTAVAPAIAPATAVSTPVNPPAPTASTLPAAPTTSSPTPTAAPNLAPIIAVGSDAGSAPWVKVYDATTGQLKFQFLAYNASFLGGVRVASADLNGDGVPDIITAPGPGMAPEIKVFDGKTGVQFAGPVGDFLAYDKSMQGGVFVAAGHVSGNLLPDIITGPGVGGGSQVRAFSGKDATLLRSFNAYDPGYEAGVPVATGYWAGAANDYIVTGTGPGAPAEVRVFNGATGLQLSGPIGDLHPYGQNFYGGVWVATGDTNGNGTSDVITGAGLGHTPEVKAFSGKDGSVLQDFQAGAASDETGVRVASTYVAGAAHEDIVTADGPGNTPQVSVYSGTTGKLQSPPEGGFLAFDKSQRNGLFVAAIIDPSVDVTLTLATEEVVAGTLVTVTVAWTSDIPAPVSPDSSFINWGDGGGGQSFPLSRCAIRFVHAHPHIRIQRPIHAIGRHWTRRQWWCRRVEPGIKTDHCHAAPDTHRPDPRLHLHLLRRRLNRRYARRDRPRRSHRRRVFRRSRPLFGRRDETRRD